MILSNFLSVRLATPILFFVLVGCSLPAQQVAAKPFSHGRFLSASCKELEQTRVHYRKRIRALRTLQDKVSSLDATAVVVSTGTALLLSPMLTVLFMDDFEDELASAMGIQNAIVTAISKKSCSLTRLDRPFDDLS